MKNFLFFSFFFFFLSYPYYICPQDIFQLLEAASTFIVMFLTLELLNNSRRESALSPWWYKGVSPINYERNLAVCCNFYIFTQAKTLCYTQVQQQEWRAFTKTGWSNLKPNKRANNTHTWISADLKHSILLHGMAPCPVTTCLLNIWPKQVALQ